MTACGRWLLAAMIPVAFGSLTIMAAAQNAPAPASPPAARTFELPPLEELTATRERPLFSPTRRPPTIVAAPDAPPPITEAVALPFELTGIARGDDVRIAILHNKTTNEELRVREGDKLDDWVLESVSDRFILLRGDGRRVRVWLFDNAKKPGVSVKADEGEESSAADAEADVDQEVVPSALPAARMPIPAAAAPPRRQIRPPGPPRTAPLVRPVLRPQVRRN